MKTGPPGGAKHREKGTIMKVEEMMRLIDEAESRIQQKLGPDDYIDDVRWGEDAFSLTIYFCDRPPAVTALDTFTFYCDPEDERSAQDKLRDELQEFIENRL